MTPECTYTLLNGRKCRGLAGHNQPFCRHHRPQVRGQRPNRPGDRYSALARWRAFGQDLPYFTPSQLPSMIYEILNALTQPDNAPSDRTAGRYLREALNRLGHVPFPDPQQAFLPPAAAPMHYAAHHPAPPAAAHPAAAQPHPPMSPSHHGPSRNANPADLAQLQREMQTLFNTLEEAQQ